MDKNKYPKGKLGKDDDGVAEIAVYVRKNAVIIHFQKQLSWIGFDADTLRKLITLLQAKLKELNENAS